MASDEGRKWMNNVIFNDMCRGTRNLLMLGCAGSGKSTLIHALQETIPTGILYTAPTGIAALNIKGDTIHSLFSLKPNVQIPDMFNKTRNTQLLKTAHTLLIDEISMLRCDVLDKIEEVLRGVRGNTSPFGGMRIIMVGDIFQLEPIADDDTKPHLRSLYRTRGDYSFYNARCFKIADFNCYELDQNYRQADDPEFAMILNAVRTGAIDDQTLPRLNSRCMAELPADPFYYITMDNTWADRYNQEQLDALPGSEDASIPEVKVYIYLIEMRNNKWLSHYPMSKELRIKENMQIMFVKNDSYRNGRRWVNGTIGIIRGMLYGRNSGTDASRLQAVRVAVGNEEYEVRREDCEIWKPMVLNGQVTIVLVATIYQFPFMAGWAMTVHKAQGLTLDKIVIEPGTGAFAAGQVYVVLSRVRRLEDYMLKKPIAKKDIIVSENTQEFYKDFNKQKLLTQSAQGTTPDMEAQALPPVPNDTTAQDYNEHLASEHNLPTSLFLSFEDSCYTTPLNWKQNPDPVSDSDFDFSRGPCQTPYDYLPPDDPDGPS